MKYLLLDTNIYIDLVISRNMNISSQGIYLLKKVLEKENVKLLIPDIVKFEFDRVFKNEVKNLLELKDFDFNLTKWKLLNTPSHEIKKDEIIKFLNNSKNEILELNKQYISFLSLEINQIFELGIILNFKDYLLINSLKNGIYGIAPCHEKRFNSSADSLLFEFLLDFISSDTFKESDTITFITSNKDDFSDKNNLKLLHKDMQEKIEKLTNNFSYNTSFFNVMKVEFSEETQESSLTEIIDQGLNSEYIWPVPSSSMISRHFGPLNIFDNDAQIQHSGIDIPAKFNDVIIASFAGEVIRARYNGAYGNTIIIDHGNETRTLYSHLSKINVVEGQLVEKGEEIGYIGSTGNSTGPHLHFELIMNNIKTNPMDYLKFV